MPTVSIIIPTYNQDRFIAQTVESALAQTYPQTEVIVVDDGSADNTSAVLAEYGGRIRHIYQENKGQSAARNTGIAASRGQYLLFLDGDDLIPPHKLELHVALLDAHPEFGLVYSGFQYLSEDGTEILGEERPRKQGAVLEDLLRRTFTFPPGAAVIRRECLDRVGLFDEALKGPVDTDMYVRIAAAGYHFGYIEQPLLLYRVVRSSVSGDIEGMRRNEFGRLDKLFARPDLPDHIRALMGEAYAVMHYEFGAKCYHVGDIESAQEHLRQAIALCPALSENREWLLEWIAGYAHGPRVETPMQFIDALFAHLPPEAVTLKGLKRRAKGRYHVAAAFRDHWGRRYKGARAHIVPAITGDPSILRNRGFLRIAADSVIKPIAASVYSIRRG